MVSKEGLKLLGQLLSLDKFTTVKIGFAEVMKVDENTFTIVSIDKDLFTEYIGDNDLLEQLSVKVKNVS